MPVVQAAWIGPGGPGLSEEAVIGYGYGATHAEATVGALGELCEEVHAGIAARRARRLRASFAELAARLGARSVCDPLTLCLSAGSTYQADMPLHWVEAKRLSDASPVWVPLDWLPAYASQIDEAPSLITPITNGLGAGLDDAHAIAHGVMELLQRDGNAVAYRALDQGVTLHLDIPPEPIVAELLARLQRLGIDVRFKLAGTDFGMADLYVVGNDRGTPLVPIQVTACGEAAHPDRDRALRKALLEFVGSRARKAATHGPVEAVTAVMPKDYALRQLACAQHEPEEARALAGMAEWLGLETPQLRQLLSASVFADRSGVAFSTLPTVAPASVETASDRLSVLAQRLAAEGLEILTIDCSPPGGGDANPPQDSEVRVFRVIVPGLECETMSYRRIGRRGVRRLRARNDPLLLSSPQDGALRVLMRPRDEEAAGGPAWFDAALADRLTAPLYPLYREPGPFSAQLLRAGRRCA